MEAILEQVAAYIRQREAGELLQAAGELPQTCPLAVRTEGAIAYFRTTASDRVEHDWRQTQTEIARLPGEQVPLRKLYLTLLVTDSDHPQPVWQHIVRDLHVCRKLVVPTDRHPVQDWIEDLPFLPISDEMIRPRSIITPAHALHEAGFRPELVQKLLTRTDMNALVKQFFSGRALRAEDDPAPEAIFLRARNRYRRLQSIEVENFRPFARPHCLPLDGDLTVVYGPNGSGKSSLAQALEWSVIGEVSTLEQSNDDIRSCEDLPPYINVMQPDSPARVRLVMTDEGDGQEHVLERHISRDGTRTALWDGRRLNSLTDALTQILDADLPATPHFSTLKAMARQSHFLDQETIRDFLSTRAQDRYRALAHMVGTVDFERAGEKIGHLLIAVGKEHEQATASAEALVTRLEAERRNLTELSRQVEALTPERGAALDLPRAAAELQQEAAGLGLPVRDGLPEDSPGLESFAQSLAAGAAAARGTQRERLDRLLALLEQEKGAGETEALARSLRDEQARQAQRLAPLEAERSEADQQVRAILAEQQQAEGTLARAEAESREANSRLVSIRALVDAGQAWVGAREAEARAERELQQAEGAAREAREAAQALAARRDRVAAEHTARQTQLADLSALRTALPELLAALTEVEETEAISQRAKQNREALLAERSQLQGQIRQADLGLTEQREAVRQLADRCAERQRLLSALARHLDSARCPLCGHDWEEAELLYQQVQAGLKDTPPDLLAAQERIAALTERLAGLNASLARVEQALAEAEAEGRSAQERFGRALTTVNRWVARAAAVGTAERADLLAQPEAMLQKWEADLQGKDLGASLAAAVAAASAAEAEADEKKARRSAALRALQDAAAVRGRAERQYLQAEQGAPPEWTRPVPTGAEVLAAAERQEMCVREARKASEALQTLKERVQTAEQRLADLRLAAEALLAQRHEADGRLRLLDQELRALQAERAALGVGPEPGAAEDEAALVRSRLSRLDRVAERARWLATSARARLLDDARAGLEQRVAAMEAELREATALGAQWQEAMDLGRRAAVALDTARADEQHKRLTYYEPTINEIYRRINPHPYFSVIRWQPAVATGELTMHATTAEGRERLPVQRYFSMAQANVVALSIFLGTALLQTWSGLRLICIDDPIQQMDDLNTAAFLDVLQGIVQRGRQVVVTTANREFYQLMLGRYAYLNRQRTRFRAFRLRGVNLTDGPDVVEDSPCFLPNGRVRLGAPAATVS